MSGEDPFNLPDPEAFRSLHPLILVNPRVLNANLLAFSHCSLLFLFPWLKNWIAWCFHPSELLWTSSGAEACRTRALTLKTPVQPGIAFLWGARTSDTEETWSQTLVGGRAPGILPCTFDNKSVVHKTHYQRSTVPMKGQNFSLDYFLFESFEGVSGHLYYFSMLFNRNPFEVM